MVTVIDPEDDSSSAKPERPVITPSPTQREKRLVRRQLVSSSEPSSSFVVGTSLSSASSTTSSSQTFTFTSTTTEPARTPSSPFPSITDPFISSSSPPTQTTGALESSGKPSGISGDSPANTGGGGVSVGAAVGAAFGALVAGVLIVLMILYIRRRKKGVQQLSNVPEAGTGGLAGSTASPITPFDRYQNVSPSELAFIQKGVTEYRYQHPNSSLQSRDPSEKRLATTSTSQFPLLHINSNPASSISMASTSSGQASHPATAFSPPTMLAASSSTQSATSPSVYSAASPSTVNTANLRSFFNSERSDTQTEDSRSTNRPAVDGVLDLQHYDVEVLRRALQLVSGGAVTTTPVEPPPAYQPPRTTSPS